MHTQDLATWKISKFEGLNDKVERIIEERDMAKVLIRACVCVCVHLCVRARVCILNVLHATKLYSCRGLPARVCMWY